MVLLACLRSLPPSPSLSKYSPILSLPLHGHLTDNVRRYAYTKAPSNMKSTVQSIALFMSAVSSALGQALVSLSEDPLLEWNYGAVAVIALFGAFGFWFTFRKADKEEDAMNALQESKYKGRAIADVEVQGAEEAEVQSVKEKSEKIG